MTMPRRSDAAASGIGDAVPVPLPRPQQPGYVPGGPVGSMQEDLSRRLAGEWTEPLEHLGREERVVRFLSVAAGYVALAAGYAVAALLVLR